MQSIATSILRVSNSLLGLALALMLAAWPTATWAGTVAARELGQPDFFHSSANTVDPESMSFNSGGAVAVDTSASPNHLYVVDTANNRVLGFSNASTLANGASATIVIGQPDLYSSVANFNNVSAQSLSNPTAAAVDSGGNVYIADSGNNRVLVFPNPFTIHTNTGQVGGFTAMMVLGQGGDFSPSSCNISAGVPDAETMCTPEGVALDSSNNLYVSDTSNNRILEFTNPVGTGVFVANKVFGQPDFLSATANNGGVSQSSLSSPIGVAVDTNNNLYVADEFNARVLEYNTPLSVTGVSGSGDTSADVVWGQIGSFATNSCDTGGVSATTLCRPFGLALDSSNNLYVTDNGRARALEYNEGANPPTNLSANHVFGQPDNTSDTCNRSNPVPAANSLCSPAGSAVDSAGDLFVADSSNNRTLEYKTPLVSGTTAEVVIGQPDFTHKAANTVDSGALNVPRQVAIDASAAPNRIFVADSTNNRVLGYRNAASFASGAPADLVIGQPDFFSSGAGTTATTLSDPTGVAVDANGDLYVADKSNNRVLEYTTPFATCAGTFPCVGGAANKVFGQSNLTSGTCNINGSTISSISLCAPEQIALDGFNNLYVADISNNRIVEYNTPLSATAVSGSGDTTGDLVIGQGTMGNEFTTSGCNQGGTESNHTLCNPSGVAIDPSNNLYVADQSNQRVLEFNETVNATTAPTTVSASTVFGQLGSFGTRNCNAAGITATALCNPFAVAVNSSGDLYVADTSNNRVLEFTSPLSSQTANIVFGQGGDFASGNANIGGTNPSPSTLSSPRSITTDSAGNVSIADTNNNRVLGYNPPFVPPGVTTHEPPPGVLSVWPERLDFAPTKRGRTSKGRTVVLTNDGNVPVNLQNFTAIGDFSYSSSCGLVLVPGQSCTLRIVFNPITVGRRGGSVTITDDAQGSPHLIDLVGHAKRTRD